MRWLQFVTLIIGSSFVMLPFWIAVALHKDLKYHWHDIHFGIAAVWLDSFKWQQDDKRSVKQAREREREKHRTVQVVHSDIIQYLRTHTDLFFFLFRFNSHILATIAFFFISIQAADLLKLRIHKNKKTRMNKKKKHRKYQQRTKKKRNNNSIEEQQQKKEELNSFLLCLIYKQPKQRYYFSIL